MPVKRRVGKARQFDDCKRQQLLEGPDACLFAGEGYLHSLSVGSFSLAGPEEQASVVEEMRADWARYGAEMMDRWRRHGPETLERPCVFRRLGSPDSLPWAAQEFGEPEEV